MRDITLIVFFACFAIYLIYKTPELIKRTKVPHIVKYFYYFLTTESILLLIDRIITVWFTELSKCLGVLKIIILILFIPGLIVSCVAAWKNSEGDPEKRLLAKIAVGFIGFAFLLAAVLAVLIIFDL